MIKTINEYEFIRAFENMGREEQFSYNGKIALFNYLEDYEENVGEQMELDIIALCCEFTEYTIEEYRNDNINIYDNIIDELMNECDIMESLREYLEERTIFIEVDEDSFIIQNY